jgi:hypothetical protein
MITNILIGFVLPWIVGGWVLRKNRSVIRETGPVAGMIAFAFNETGYYMDWWKVTPVRGEILSFLPYNLGLFPVIGCLFIYTVQKSTFHPALLLLSYPFLITALEIVFRVTGKVTYGNGWNPGWTYVSYLLACSLTYAVYHVFNKDHSDHPV